MLAEALVATRKTGERVYEAELYRLKGQLTLQQFEVSGFTFQVAKSPRSEGCPERSRRVQGPKSQNTDPRSLTPDPQSEAEACFHKAIDAARKQQAKSLELRATVNLARLRQRQGKQKEAHKMLSEIYGWFTEGFDTKDLQEAKALIEELHY